MISNTCSAHCLLKTSKTVHWRTNLWKNNLRQHFEFNLFSYSTRELEAHGIDYVENVVTMLNYRFTWRIQKRG